MNILVTGADGMLGSNLIRLLLIKKHKVSVLLHPSSKSKTLDGLEITRFWGDILNPESLNESFANIDAVIHAAASTSIWPARSEKVKQINIQGTQNIIDKVLEFGIAKMIYIGSGSSVNTERSEGKYQFPGAKFGLDYIDSKFEALNLVLDSVKTKNLPAIAILPTYMIGAYDSLPGSGKIVLAVAKGKLKFYTSGGRNFIHVKDVAAAIVNSLDKTNYGKYYIVGNENLSYKEFCSLAASIVNQPKPKIKIPSVIIKMFGSLGSFIGKLLGKQPVLSKEAALISCENQFVSSEDAIRDLNLPQTPVKIAVQDCYNWFKSNGYC